MENKDIFSYAMNGISNPDKKEQPLPKVQDTVKPIDKHAEIIPVEQEAIAVDKSQQVDADMLREFIEWKKKMDTTKPFYESKITMSGYGLVVTVIVALFARYQIDVSPDDVMNVILGISSIVGMALPYWRKHSISKGIR